MANAFESEVSQSFRVLRWHYVKIPVATAPGVRFLMDPPYDYFAVADGTPLSIEAKSVKVRGAFPFDKVKPHQIKALHQAHACGSKVFILVNFRPPTRADRETYAIPFMEFEKLRTGSGRKSIPSSMFNPSNKSFISIPRVHIDDELVWDLRPILHYNEEK